MRKLGFRVGVWIVALSLALWVAFWIRSQRATENLSYYHEKRCAPSHWTWVSQSFIFSDGRFLIYSSWIPFPSSGNAYKEDNRQQDTGGRWQWSRTNHIYEFPLFTIANQFGFGVEYHAEAGGYQFRMWFPCWVALLPFVPVVVTAARRARRALIRRQRRRTNLCVNCGYDLRSGHTVCPECGSSGS